MEIVFGLDFDSDASATFRHNFPDAAFHQGDIADVDPADVVAKIRSGPGPLLISACAPCQPYSGFRRNGKSDPRRSLLLRLLPILARLEPDYVLVENVPGLKNQSSRAGTYARFCKALRVAGYDLVSDVLDCQQFGVPQRRRRLILMASRRGSVQLPESTHGVGRLPLATVDEWIGDLPPIGPGETHPSVPNHTASGLTDLNLRRLQATPVGGGRADWPDDLVLDCHLDHTGHSDVYGRMRADAPAPSLTTKCTSLSNGRFGHPTQDRPISVREAASLQTFQRDFVFMGGIKSATRQVGNAVPVLLAQRIGEAFQRGYATAGDPAQAFTEETR